MTGKRIRMTKRSLSGDYLIPDWPLPAGVFAAVTTVTSPGNLAAHVNAEPAAVVRHRRQLVRDLGLPCAPRWLQQYHGTEAVDFAEIRAGAPADAVFSRQSASVCAVLTADCLPVLLASCDGSEIAAVHAGWRGLAAGVIENTLQQLTTAPADMRAWIGPAISPAHFEVGGDVFDVFAARGLADSQNFLPQPHGKWLADLPDLARKVLNRAGVPDVTLSRLCSYSDPRWYSYRRTPTAGRFASMIWKN